MVQVSNQIFNDLKEKIEKVYPLSKVQKDYQPTSNTFPTITLYELDNAEFSHTLDYTERKSNIAVQIDIYTVGGTRETQAKEIADKVSKVMEEKWHTKREYSKPMINADMNIYRYTMRYSFKIDEDSLRIYS